MARKPTEQKMIAIEPVTMQVPTMDRPSIAFAWFLDRMLVEMGDAGDESVCLMCDVCSTLVLDLTPGVTLREALNTALAHGC